MTGLLPKELERKLPKELTTYDLLKTLAVLLMIADHVGYFLFPEDNWWRVFGRLCVPMWFFLVGYARSRDIGPRLWIGAGLLVLGSFLYGHYIFALNILATIILVRLTMDPLVKLFLKSDLGMLFVGAVLALAVIPSSLVFEYGTMGYILAFLGYFVRNQQDLKNSSTLITVYSFYAFMVFVFTQYIFHGFNMPQLFVLSFGVSVVLFMLSRFEGRTLQMKLPAFIRAPLQFTGRKTLEIYVVHILILGFAAMALGDERLGFLDWKWMPPLW